MIDIIKISLDESYNLSIVINVWFILAPFVLGWLIYYIFLKKKSIWHKSLEFDGAEIGIKGQKIKIKSSFKNIQIAYQLWVELNTRKIGQQIDFDNDVLEEVYNSWYDFFKVTRELIKDMPINKAINDENTQKIIFVATEVLNEGIRPYLTKWQAKFKKWYRHELKDEKNKALSPQQIQKKYEKYDELKDDMKAVNESLIGYKLILEKITFGETRKSVK